MDTRELARLLELARDGKLNHEQLVALRDLLATDPQAEIWWRHALALDQRLTQALVSQLEPASMSQTTRDDIRAQLRSRPARLMLRRVAPVLLVLSLILFALSVGRVWFSARTGTQPPAQATPFVPTAPIGPPTQVPPPSPTLFAMPTPTPFTPEEAATATAAMEAIQVGETATSEMATMARATTYAQTAEAAELDPSEATSDVATATALAPFLPATRTAQVPTDLAATVMIMRTEDAALTATATNMAPAAAATATADAQTATALAPFVPATRTAQVPTDLAATPMMETAVAGETATAVAGTATAESAAPTRTPTATETAEQPSLCDEGAPVTAPCVTPTLTTTPRS